MCFFLNRLQYFILYLLSKQAQDLKERCPLPFPSFSICSYPDLYSGNVMNVRVSTCPLSQNKAQNTSWGAILSCIWVNTSSSEKSCVALTDHSLGPLKGTSELK